MCLLDNVTTLAQCKNGTVGLAHFMANLGAYDAINLDGGGSTGMWIKKAALAAGSIPTSVCQTVTGAKNPDDRLLREPSDHRRNPHRRASAQSAVMVLNGPDTNEPL